MVMRERSRRRTKRVTGPAAPALAQARAAAKAARHTRRAAIAAVKDDATARLYDLFDARKTREKSLYGDYVQTRGLYWATFNDVLDHHRTAVKVMQQKRARGRPAALRHHRWDGSGTVAVQLQRQAGRPPRTPAAIADTETGPWRNVLHLPGWVHPDQWDQLTRAQQRQTGRVTARMRCGTSTDPDGGGTAAAHIDVPVQVHRMLPADADITGARLTIRRVAGGNRAFLTVTAKVPDPGPISDGPSVALHLGWRDGEDSTIVATWRASSALAIPIDLRHIVHADPGALTGTIRIPHGVADRLAALDTIRAARDTALNEARDDLVGWLTAHGPVDHPTRDGETITAADVARWRSPARFAVLARAWLEQPPPAAHDIAASLERWRGFDRREWERQEHGRGKVLGHRDDLYRQVAAVIAGQAGALVVDDTNIAQIAGHDTDLPHNVAQRIAHRRTIAAPATLREDTTSACVREGVTVHTVTAAGLSRVHAACGHENPADDRYLTRTVPCDGCGATYDPDASATVLMLARAVTPNTPPAQTVRAASS